MVSPKVSWVERLVSGVTTAEFTIGETGGVCAMFNGDGEAVEADKSFVGTSRLELLTSPASNKLA